MKILQLISSAGFYGAEACLLSLSEALRQAGHDVTIGTFRNHHCPNDDLHVAAVGKGFATRIFTSSGRSDFSARRALREFVREQRFDVVHAHGYKADLAVASARLGNVALISTCHGWPTPGFKMQTYAVLDRLALRRFDRIVSVSRQTADKLRQSGINASRVSIIPNGVSVSRFARSRTTSESRLRIGIIGRIVEEKGSAIALAAFERIASEFPNAELVFVGEGPLREQLQRRALERGIYDRVIFYGFCSDIPAMYATLDVVALPSFHENLPMVILEAMAAGVAVVATPVGDVPSVIEDNATGMLVLVGDAQGLATALRTLLQDRELRSRLGEMGARHVAAKFDIAAVAERYLEVYRAAGRRSLTTLSVARGEIG